MDEAAAGLFDDAPIDAAIAFSEAAADGDAEPDRDRPRRWTSRLITQKTLTGTITVRKWVSDEGPQYVARVRASDLNTHVCSFHDCGKAFPDAASLRKHMHTHGEKQYVCQVEVRSAALAASVHP